MGLRESITSNRSPEYVNDTYLEPMRERWLQEEQEKRERVHKANIARLENQKLNITIKIEQLDHSKARYLQSIRAINVQIAALTDSVG
jgi:hypothetical protein